ncbi:MAG TPA: hypothetical protein VG754_00910 [Verrucomicrobiae bacterium]|jgi:hypothetical protein|nr:hypothetical protein [Verrucomicrobiae bacterium]
MSETRTFSVCQGCGAWKETSANILEFFADYDMRFFIEQHATRCPATGAPAVLIAVSEDDANYRPLSTEKQWKPESYPGYRPPQKPRSIRHTTDIPERLLGIWATSHFGSHSDESLVFFPDGTGILEYWNVGFAGYQNFCWRLDGQERLLFGGANDEPTENVDSTDGAVSYFGTMRAYFELLLSTDIYGEQSEMLCLYRGDIQDEAQEFFRSKRSLENYKIPDEFKP